MTHLLIILLLLLPLPSRAAEFAIATGTANTGTGNTDYTVSGFGTPACAMVFATYGTADGTAVDHGGVAIGATDGTNQLSLMGASENGQTAADVGGAQNTSDTFRMVTAAAQATTEGTASGSLITDGVRLNTTDAFAAAYQVKALLIGGSGVAGCTVGSVTTGGVLDGSVTVNTVGFTADVILFWSLSDTSSTPSSNGLSFGVCVRSATSCATQYGYSFNDVSSANPTQVQQMLNTDGVTRRVSGGVNGALAEIGNIGASGFDVTQRDNATAVTLQYLAIDLNGIGAAMITDASPTSTGSEAITGAGFTPQFALGLYGTAVANDTFYSDGNAESWGIGLMTASTSACVGMTSDDNVSPSNTESLTNSIALCLRKDEALFQAASLTSFDSDGMTLNNTTANGTARQRIFLFIEAGAAASSRTRQMPVFYP